MNVLRSISDLATVRGPVVLAVGVFDGFHLGHRAVIERALADAAVAGGTAVVVTFDPAHRRNWLADYLPELIDLDERIMPPMSDYRRWLGPVEIAPVPIPHDCSDGFLYAYWQRPRAYLDPRIRTAMSSFWTIGGAEDGLRRLADDLDSGRWHERYGHLMGLDAIDAGYRLVTTASSQRSTAAVGA